METAPLETDLSGYTVTLPPDEFLPRDAPREKLDLMQHHAHVEALEKAYLRIEQETGLMRDQLTHRWFIDGRMSTCVFEVRENSVPVPAHPGISLVKG